MISGNLAVVTQVMPDKHGVLVAFRNGVEFSNVEGGDQGDHFVRVLERRAHPTGGATQCLPELGELGLVIGLDNGTWLWVGSVPWEERNQQDSRTGIECWRHPSGVQCITTADGDCQFFHPSGLTMTVSADGNSIPEMQGTMPVELLADQPGAGMMPFVRLWHPSELDVLIDPEGNLSIDSPGKLAGTFQGAVDVIARGCATVTAPRITANGTTKFNDVALVKTGASGTFTSPSGQVITVQSGIITNIFGG